MNNTKIEWASATWNPVTGCEHGCEYCYARSIAHRFAMKDTKVGESVVGFVLDEKFKGAGGKTEPFPFGFTPTFHRYRLDEPQHKQGPLNIFVCSMADLFGEWVPDEWIKQVFEACRKALQHRYMFLTKNPARYGKLRAEGQLPKEANLWYGVTATNQQQAEAAFRHIPNGWDGYNLFLSAEPLYGEINVPALESFPRLVIIGAETGNRKGKTLPHRLWVDGTANSAKSVGAAVFMKDSLLPIVGEEHMRRELPQELRIY